MLQWLADKISGVEQMASSVAHQSTRYVGDGFRRVGHTARGLYGEASSLILEEKTSVQSRVSQTKVYQTALALDVAVEDRLDKKNHQAAELRFDLALAEDRRLEKMGLSHHDPIYQNYGDLCGSGRDTMDFFSDVTGALSFCLRIRRFHGRRFRFYNGRSDCRRHSCVSSPCLTHG